MESIEHKPVGPEMRAIVDGVLYTKIPDDLFIPPDALEILLDSFSGPLDLLLYLIRKQNIDILNIPIVSITNQYLQYIEIIELQKMELAAEYLLMAAVLAEIKSRMLLPTIPVENEAEEEDPRMQLVRRLLAYEQIKQAAQLLDALPRHERDNCWVQVITPEEDKVIPLPEVQLQELLHAMQSILVRCDLEVHHEIAREVLTVRERMSQILEQLKEHAYLELTQLFTAEEGRPGLVVSFLAILELARQSLLVITQAQSFAPIHIKAA